MGEVNSTEEVDTRSTKDVSVGFYETLQMVRDRIRVWEDLRASQIFLKYFLRGNLNAIIVSHSW